MYVPLLRAEPGLPFPLTLTKNNPRMEANIPIALISRGKITPTTPKVNPPMIIAASTPAT